MPLSPFTRFFGLAIIAAYFLALLWPDESAALWGWQTLIVLPIVIGLFSWSAVHDAPPFDDQAFHRVLPPGDGVALRRVLMIHGMVLAGIAVAVIIYCRIYNFGGSATAYGIAILTIPAWTLMAASGIANSLSTSRQSGITWPYLAIFAIPALSAFLICWLRDYFITPQNPYRYRYPLLQGLSTIAVAGAILYPIIWWLVAVKRRRGLGFGLGIATGLLIPWMYGVAEHLAPSYVPSGKSHVTITRKAAVPAYGKWIRVNETLSVDGLRKGEFADLDLSVNQNGLSAYEVPDDSALEDARVHYSPIIAGRFEDGTLSWGETAAWNYLRSQVPSPETFQFWWSQREGVPTHLAFLRPGKSALVRGPFGDTSRKPVDRQNKAEADFASNTWGVWSPGVFIFEKAGEVDASDGGTCKLPGGGILRVNPLKQEGKSSSISFRRYYEDPWQSRGRPWFGLKSPGNRWTVRPWVIAVDPSGKHAFALPSAFPVGQDERVMLGQFTDYVIYTGEAKTADELARVEMLRHSRLHVFWPKWVAPLQEEIPPPH
ncbi:MAG: hypothetical protein V4819_06930 [Verrucomicrobiota bacterium]